MNRTLNVQIRWGETPQGVTKAFIAKLTSACEPTFSFRRTLENDPLDNFFFFWVVK